jgi:hypothetical protein
MTVQEIERIDGCIPAAPLGSQVSIQYVGRRVVTDTLIGTRCTSSTRFWAVTTISCNWTELVSPAALDSIGNHKATDASAIETAFIMVIPLPHAVIRAALHCGSPGKTASQVFSKAASS